MTTDTSGRGSVQPQSALPTGQHSQPTNPFAAYETRNAVSFTAPLPPPTATAAAVSQDSWSFDALLAALDDNVAEQKAAAKRRRNAAKKARRLAARAKPAEREVDTAIADALASNFPTTESAKELATAELGRGKAARRAKRRANIRAARAARGEGKEYVAKVEVPPAGVQTRKRKVKKTKKLRAGKKKGWPQGIDKSPSTLTTGHNGQFNTPAPTILNPFARDPAAPNPFSKYETGSGFSRSDPFAAQQPPLAAATASADCWSLTTLHAVLDHNVAEEKAATARRRSAAKAKRMAARAATGDVAMPAEKKPRTTAWQRQAARRAARKEIRRNEKAARGRKGREEAGENEGGPGKGMGGAQNGHPQRQDGGGQSTHQPCRLDTVSNRPFVHDQKTVSSQLDMMMEM
ncbi:hypothetical protein EDC01DRAFT_776357 [Geopyxis carbonaria]|nr:hypothetical protein EDC01DRAFT_776357 [Geopyxis carbonaria]